ncbi:MAG: FKBP-type peptidyl-prolyl cis-trans isomerase [Lachnospiraceae bacterium]|nr:FKBP-type peptidyl-prolyl cis-trans isomerase [Lachnospiraceae bacterium]
MDKVKVGVLSAVAVASIACVVAGYDKKGEGSKTYVNLGKYKGIEAEALKKDVSEEEINSVIDQYLQSSTIKDETNTTVDDGETININYSGKIDDVAFEGGTAEDQMLTIGSHMFIEGFEEGLIGKNVGDTVQIQVTFPDPYVNNPDLAGKPAVFDVTINYITRAAQATDEDIKAIGTYESLEALRNNVVNILTQNKETESDNKFQLLVMAKVVNACEFGDITYSDIEDLYNDEYTYYDNYATYNLGGMDVFLENIQMTKEEFEQLILEVSIRKYKEDLVLDKIAKAEKITISNKEYKEALEEAKPTYANYGITEEDFIKSNGGEKAYKLGLRREKTKKYVIEKAKVSEYVDTIEDVQVGIDEYIGDGATNSEEEED